jgi:hypothetical protein
LKHSQDDPCILVGDCHRGTVEAAPLPKLIDPLVIEVHLGWRGLELQYLSELDLDFDVRLTGFELPEIDLLIGELTPANSNDEADAVIPVASGAAITRAGDVWKIGSHRLICGDSTKRETYQHLLGDARAQLVFTDPHYNVPISGQRGKLVRPPRSQC